ncbi:MAG: hypothetical protein OIN66_10475 [Candidatus Methanoperedens sp.]|nr:hypothetical protein [Candidatus Methanoperedens sp.]
MPFGLDLISNIADVPYYTESILKYGQFPLWNDLWFVGFPQYSSPLTSFYYPVSTIIYFLFGGLQGVKILIPLHFLLSGIGFWVFSSLLTGNKVPRLYGSLLYMLSGSLVARVYAGHLQMFMALSYIPFSIYFVIKAIDTRERRYIGLSALTMSLPILMGAPYYFAYFLLMLLALTVIRTIEYKDKGFRIRTGDLSIICIIAALTFGVSGIMSVPILYGSGTLERNVDPLGGSDTIDNLIFSFFMGENLNFDTIKMWGYDQKWTWENYSFIGLIPLVLASLSIFHKSRYRKFLYASLVILIIYAQGPFTHFYWLHYFPFFDNLRIASRILAFAAFILVSMAVLGLDWFLNENEKGDGISRHILIIMAFFMLVSGLEYLKMFSSDYNPAKTAILAKIIIILGLAYLIFRQPVKKNNILMSIILFSLLALIVSNSQLLAPSPFIPTDIKSDQYLQELWSENGMRNNGTPFTIEGAGNGGLNSLVGYSLNSQNIRYYNVGYGYTYKYRPQTIDIAGTQYTTLDYRLDYNDFQKFDFILQNNSLPYAFNVNNNQIRPMKLKYYSPNKITVDGKDISGIIVVKNAFHTGWKVEGAPVKNYNGLIAVDSDGRQEYSFVFSPDDFKMGALITIFSLILCAILYISPKTSHQKVL